MQCFISNRKEHKATETQFKLSLEITWQISIWNCCIMYQRKQKKNLINQDKKKPVKSIHKETNQMKNKIKYICKVNHQNPLSLR